MRRLTQVSALVLVIALLTGCAAGRAFRRGESRARVGDWDAAVTYYRAAFQANPDRAEYRIALERAMLNASRLHFDNARALEAKDQLDAALLEYRRTVEFDPGNTQALDRVVQLEKIIRDRLEASRPKPAIVQLREEARQVSAAPLLNPASRAPLDYNFKQANLRDILTFIGSATGINVIYDASFQDRPVTVTLQGSIEQVLNTLLSSNGMFYTVLDERTIVVAQDSAPNRLKYERQVALTIPLQFADVTEMIADADGDYADDDRRDDSARYYSQQDEQLDYRAGDRARDRRHSRAGAHQRQAARRNYARRRNPGSRQGPRQAARHKPHPVCDWCKFLAGKGAASEPARPTPRPFNLNTITQGVSTADFYLTVPQAFVNFLQADTDTKLLANTQLRGAEGSQLLLNIGAREPYLATVFSPIAGGGANVNPLSSYTFEQVGISVQATPRVTDEGDIMMSLVLKSSALGPRARLVAVPRPRSQTER